MRILKNLTRFLLIYLLIRGSNFELNFDNWSKLLSSLLPRKAILVHLKTVYFQKQPSRDVPTKKDVLKILSKFTEEHPCQSVISIKLQSNFGSSGGLFLYFEIWLEIFVNFSVIKFYLSFLRHLGSLFSILTDH